MKAKNIIVTLFLFLFVAACDLPSGDGPGTKEPVKYDCISITDQSVKDEVIAEYGYSCAIGQHYVIGRGNCTKKPEKYCN